MCEFTGVNCYICLVEYMQKMFCGSFLQSEELLINNVKKKILNSCCIIYWQFLHFDAKSLLQLSK